MGLERQKKFSYPITVNLNLVEEDVKFLKEKLHKGLRAYILSNLFEKLIEHIKENGLGPICDNKVDLVIRDKKE